MKAIIECFSATYYKELRFRWPSAAKTLAGLLGDDQSASRFSGTMKSFPDLRLCICEFMNKISLLVLFWYQEFARSDWMGLSGGDQTCQNNFPTGQNNFPLNALHRDWFHELGFEAFQLP